MTESTTATASSALLNPLASLLMELFEVIAGLTDDAYSLKPVGPMKSSIGGRVPERFGYAPSTLAHAKQKPCAR